MSARIILLVGVVSVFTLLGAECSEGTGAAANEGPPAASRPDAPALTDIDAMYGSLLKDLITDDGLVRYDLLREGGRLARLEGVVAGYGSVNLPREQAGRLAFWINAYNSNVMLMIYKESRKEGFVNVKKVSGFFNRKPVRVAGETMTLNGIENDHVRKLVRPADPRPHAALVCAAKSCPPLRNEPYVAERLDEQLEDQCRVWVNDGRKNRVEGGKLGVSSIFKWYRGDFKVAPYGGVTGFVKHFAEPGGELAGLLAKDGEPGLRWLKYDWGLNEE